MTKIVLPNRFDINTVTAVHAEIIAALENPGSCLIDAREVEVVDCAGLQLLIACESVARLAGLDIHVLPIPQALEASYRLAGLPLPATEIYAEEFNEKNPGGG